MSLLNAITFKVYIIGWNEEGETTDGLLLVFSKTLLRLECCVEHFSNCSIAAFAEDFWFSFDHWLPIHWFFSRGRTRLAFSFFLTNNFFLFPLGGDSRYIYLLFLAGFFFCYFLAPWILVDIRLVNIYIYIYISSQKRQQQSFTLR